ncbi:MAG: hypothetical protein RIQ94_3421 [Pseudomonadota bacterium]|jgi:hypothetical protein
MQKKASNQHPEELIPQGILAQKNELEFNAYRIIHHLF